MARCNTVSTWMGLEIRGYKNRSALMGACLELASETSLRMELRPDNTVLFQDCNEGRAEKLLSGKMVKDALTK